MNPLIIIAALGAAGFALLSGGKKQTPGTTSGTTIKVPVQPATIKTPVGTLTVTPPSATGTSTGTTIKVPGGTITVPETVSTSTSTGTTIAIPEVKITPELPPAPSVTPASTIDVPAAPTAAEQAKDAAALSRDEQISIESDLANDLYGKAMASQHLAYVAAAGLKLASLGDSRAMDLTLRVANWGH